MKLKKDRETAKLALEWCMKKWGKSRYFNDYPKLYVYKNCQNDLTGWFTESKNVIGINLKHQKSVLELVKTVIHEYTHYRQNTVELYDKLARKYKNRPYEEHPQEKHAYKMEKAWGKICKTQIAKKVVGKP